MILNKLENGYFTIKDDEGGTLSYAKTYNALLYETKLNAEKDLALIVKCGLPKELIFVAPFTPAQRERAQGNTWMK